MKIQYTGKNTEVTAAIRQFSDKKISRLESFSDCINSIHITFHIDKMDQIAEANIAVPGQIIHATSSSHDLYAAIDGLIDKLFRQLKKYKEKMTERR